MKAFTKTVAIACCLIPEAVALRIIADVSLDIPKWMHFETQADDFSCARHTLNNLLNLLVPEESRDWDEVAFPTHGHLVACVGEDTGNNGWKDRQIAQALFEKSKHKFGVVSVDESEIPSSEPEDGRYYKLREKSGTEHHATFIYRQPEVDGQCLPGWKKVCSGLGMTHFNNWEECRRNLLDGANQGWTLQVVSRGDSCFQDRFGRDVPICSVPLPKDDFQSSELYVNASPADQLFRGGEMYWFGLGVSKDYAKAFHLYKRAAVCGHAHAHEQLGFMFMSGDGADFPSNLDMAEAWFRSAAELGRENAAHALFDLGKMYLNSDKSRGVSKDYKKAFELFNLAAVQGNPSVQGKAHYQIGLMFMQGFGVPKSDVMAIKWFRSGVDLGDASSQTAVGRFHQEGWGGVKKDMDQALKFYQQAADQGDSLAEKQIKKIEKMNSRSAFWKKIGL